MEWLQWLFSTEFMPSLQCIKHDPLVLTARIMGDGMFFLAYLMIPYMLNKYRRVAGGRLAMGSHLVIGFMAFIAFCGFSHLDDILMLWWPARRADAAVRIAGGIVSLVVAKQLGTAVVSYAKQIAELRAERDEMQQSLIESQARLNELRSNRSFERGDFEPAS